MRLTIFILSLQCAIYKLLALAESGAILRPQTLGMRLSLRFSHYCFSLQYLPNLYLEYRLTATELSVLEESQQIIITRTLDSENRKIPGKDPTFALPPSRHRFPWRQLYRGVGTGLGKRGDVLSVLT